MRKGRGAAVLWYHFCCRTQKAKAKVSWQGRGVQLGNELKDKVNVLFIVTTEAETSSAPFSPVHRVASANPGSCI